MSWIEGSLATGTPYIPRTGLYQLHQGEAVIPASQNTGAGARPITISFGNIVINGENKNPDKLADELVSKVREKMRQIDARK